MSLSDKTSKPFKKDQENFWAGEFGTAYILRNQSDALLASKLKFYSKALRATRSVKTCIEFGANIGMNLRALGLLHPEQEQYGIEINPDAAQQLAQVIPLAHTYPTSISDFQPQITWDLVLIKGVLIHINPDELSQVYDKLVSACDRYLLGGGILQSCACVTIPYRRHTDRLFKRDFAGEIMDRHPQMKLLDYGFSYHRDPDFPRDDITWFLMKKCSG